MNYLAEVRGISPIIMHNGATGLDTRSPIKMEIAEIARKKGSNRTEADDIRIRELECQNSLYIDEDSGRPTLPPSMFRACIEEAARKLKQGPQVREGLIVESVDFSYDTDLGETAEELGKHVQFTVGVVVSRARVLRTRAKFDVWGAKILLLCDDELVDENHLYSWFHIAGRRIGVGDWRPSKSGQFGRFETVLIQEQKER